MSVNIYEAPANHLQFMFEFLGINVYILLRPWLMMRINYLEIADGVATRCVFLFLMF